MKPQVVAYHARTSCLADDAIVAADSGTVATWAARYVDIRDDDAVLAVRHAGHDGERSALQHRRRRWPIPGRQVVCIVGDGGFTMLMGEMATLVKYKLPVKVDRHQEQRARADQMGADGARGQSANSACELQPIDFAAVAPRLRRRRLHGGASPTQAESTLRQALAHPGPAVVEAVVDPNEPPMPGHVTTDQAVKFAEALARGQKDAWLIIKTVVEDRVREVV